MIANGHSSAAFGGLGHAVACVFRPTKAMRATARGQSGQGVLN